MPAHQEINSKSDFESAINSNSGKYVLIYAYENQIAPRAEEYAEKYKSTTAPYKVDVTKHDDAKQWLNISTAPSAVVYSNGKEVTTVEGMDPSKMQEVAKMLEKGV
ncbi:hypothetical protein LTR66_007723 [Elasticomyces elasticus]|nr:hypothetical protein LTR50_005733 [Elasticomyces elasticus]KAK4986967.1 hypothetical protein LTR66_007723 [Elasticomyces elasticus]